MPNLSDNSWKEVRHKRITAFASKWQDCTASSYYTINRILLLCVGLWPYQKSSFRYIIIAFMTIMLISSVVIQFTVFITKEYSVDLLLRILAYSIPWVGYTLKYNALCFNIKKMRGLMERIQYDWNELNNAQEIEIMKKYSAIGRFITLIITLFMYSSIFGFILVQLLSNFLLKIVMTVNESHPRQFPVMVEYFVDQQEYFIPLLLHISLIVLCGLTTVIATETIHMSYMQHVCGLFQIASCRIEQTLQNDIMRGIACTAERNMIIRRGIISAFNIYAKAIDWNNEVLYEKSYESFIHLINNNIIYMYLSYGYRYSRFIQMSMANFKWGYTFLLPLGVVSLSINLYRLSRLITTEDYYEMTVSLTFISGHFWYMFFGNYLGQEVIDHSGDIFHRTYNVQWYIAPLETQKLLLLIMQRTMRHCTLIIGGLFIPSLEGFATLTSVSISYFTMILSML